MQLFPGKVLDLHPGLLSALQHQISAVFHLHASGGKVNRP